MRTLQIYSGNLFGGVERTLTMIAEARGESEREFALCFDGRLRRDLLALGARVHDLGRVRIRWPWTVLRARRAMRAVLAERGYDVGICHSHWAHALFGGIVRRAGLPLVLWLHDEATGRHWLERWARRTRPDLVICNSAFTARSAASLYGGVPTVVIHPPLSLSAAPDAAERAVVRRSLGADSGVVVIIQVSRLDRLKGHDVHIEALGMLRDIAPRWQCWIVGGSQRPHEDGYLRALRRRAGELGIADRMRFLGERADVAALLQAADILCQPNTRPDAFGIAFVEGLAAARPVVTSALGGALEIVDDSCGFLTAPGDAPALAAVLRRLIGDPALRGRTGAAGPARARALCDPVTQMARLDAVLLGVVGARGVGATA